MATLGKKTSQRVTADALEERYKESCWLNWLQGAKNREKWQKLAHAYALWLRTASKKKKIHQGLLAIAHNMSANNTSFSQRYIVKYFMCLNSLILPNNFSYN